MEYDRVRDWCTAVRVLASLGDDDYAKFAQHRACDIIDEATRKMVIAHGANAYHLVRWIRERD